MWSLLLSLACATAPVDNADTVLICAEQYIATLQPWLQHRRAQGHEFAWIPNTGTRMEIRAAIRGTAVSGKLRNIVIVGDAFSPDGQGDVSRELAVPTHFGKANVNVQWGSEPEIASDNWYADLDDDQLPDLTVGRITADGNEDLATIVRKIIHYENAVPDGSWQRRINFVAGVGGFGVIADSVLEMATKKFLTEGVPPSYLTSMTYGSWRSPYCPDPRRVHRATLERLNEGSLFWVYIGHGHRNTLDRVRIPGGGFHLFDKHDADKLVCSVGHPIAVLLACYTGAYDAPEDCLAEEMLRAKGGPIAILAGSRVTMPYAMAVLGTEMMNEYFVQRRATLGEILLHAKRRLARQEDVEQFDSTGENADATRQRRSNRQMLDQLATVLSPSKKMLEEERREHLLLFNLIGDPLLRLPQAVDCEVFAEKEASSGENIRVKLKCPLVGNCRIEVACRRDTTRAPIPPRREFQFDADSLLAYDEVYAFANDSVWSLYELDFPGGVLEVDVPIPPEATGPGVIRMCVMGPDQFALGATEVFFRRSKKPLDVNRDDAAR
ncbi:MAG: C25 family cysteine peptidase [Pirellulaceae bacterium]|nr:C25 family cysteine peptidase [Pirellulaceae bacterium]